MSAIDPTPLLYSLNAAEASLFFLLVMLVDVPRYTLAFCALAAAARLRRAPAPAFRPASISVIVVGHNEAQPIRRCILSLHEQTWRGFEIVCIDDGSTDGMHDELRRLRLERRIDAFFSLQHRGGKSAGCNLGLAGSTGEIIVFVDADTTLDRDAIARLLQPFADARVGAVTGNLGVRNPHASLLSGLQAFEYMLSCSAGKQLFDQFGQVSCISGAFCAYRRSAIESLGGFDVGPGEDLDLGLRLRLAGWTLRFAADAWCLTDVPETLSALVRQRRRWERDTVRLRLRTHAYSFNPLDRRFRTRELPHQLEFLLTHVVSTVVVPIYLVWLAADIGPIDALTVLSSTMLVFLLLDAVAALCAHTIVERVASWRLLPYVAVFGLYQVVLMRAVRMLALSEEWLFQRSRHDPYVPARVAREAADY